MNPEIVFLSDMKESDGKTVRENNMERPHSFAMGDFLEVECSCGSTATDHNVYCGLRGYVTKLSRDCDGTPGYFLSPQPTYFCLDINSIVNRIHHFVDNRTTETDVLDFIIELAQTGGEGMFGEESLKLIRKGKPTI